MSTHRLVNRLLRYGRSVQSQPSSVSDRPADRFVRENWNAWLIAVFFDQGIPYERAWQAPYVLQQRLGHLDVQRLAETPVLELREAIASPPALHRYVGTLPVWIRQAAIKLVAEYAGEASNIWTGCLTAGEVIARFDAFPGIGQKKAHMATQLLLCDQRAGQFTGWDQINLAVDVHVRRVWMRAGLSTDPSTRGIMRAAATLWPKYPGQLDLPTWLIGMTWCHARRPDCRGERHRDREACPLLRVCPKTGSPAPEDGSDPRSAPPMNAESPVTAQGGPDADRSHAP